MQSLGAYAGGRDNNFNLLRLVAAMMVLISHSFALATGTITAEPWHEHLGITPGSLAVDIFFIASGFLVTGSLCARGNVPQFLLARFLRIYPGLAVAVLSTTLVLGLFFCTLSFGEFLAQRDTWRYVVRNILLVLPDGIFVWKLPGVFEDHISGNAVNGSLWTLTSEVRLYVILCLAWLAIGFLGGAQRRLIGLVALALAIAGFAWHFGTRGDGVLTMEPRLLAFFFSGSVMYVWRNTIPASWTLFTALLALTLFSAWDREVFGVVWLFTLPYLVLFFALVPAGPIRGFNRIGDYSYGVYIYAFPVQKILVDLNPGITPWALMPASAAVTLVLAVASWYGVEEPALRLKERGWGGALRPWRAQA
jgi:peptidoglycan/LPS O-acetylase OafA/YrhL